MHCVKVQKIFENTARVNDGISYTVKLSLNDGHL